MRTITLVKIRMTNFKSYKKETIVEFSKEPGFKFLGGKNLSEPRLGANGSGKSTLWDALFWCFYGTSVRDLRASELITFGEKECSVAADIAIGRASYTISRTAPPNKLYLDGNLVEQPEIDQLLGLNKDRFRHSVLFGQQVDLFPDLAMPDRANLLDDVLDLSVWARASRSPRRRG